MTQSLPADAKVRPLAARDLDRMVAIDQAHTGASRRRFFEKRLAAAATEPGDFIHVGVEAEGGLIGFAFARVLAGEFGRPEPVAVLDLVGVDPSEQAHGIGHALMDALTAGAEAHGVRLMHSQADWTDHGLLRFFAGSGFQLAPRLVLERPVAVPLAEPVDDV